jgi:hypothetical protein
MDFFEGSMTPTKAAQRNAHPKKNNGLYRFIGF